MWQEILFLNKRQRWSLAVVTVFVLVFQLLIWTQSLWGPLLLRSFSYTQMQDASSGQPVEFVSTDSLNRSSVRPTLEDRTKERQVVEDRTEGVQHESIPTERPVSVAKSVQIPSIPLRFEVNAVDSATLVLLKGVGAISASRLIAHRKRLGGFYDLKQLNEIKGLHPDVLKVLNASLIVDATHIQRLSVNEASLERLKAHPYVSFFQAKTIVELRQARKGIRSLDELMAFDAFQSEDMMRLGWYLEL